MLSLMALSIAAPLGDVLVDDARFIRLTPEQIKLRGGNTRR